jgi:hypothetical protein
MHEILATTKYEQGIMVHWEEGGVAQNTLFTYEELVALKINAFDLLENPNLYWVDEKKHLLYGRRFCTF